MHKLLVGALLTVLLATNAVTGFKLLKTSNNLDSWREMQEQAQADLNYTRDRELKFMTCLMEVDQRFGKWIIFSKQYDNDDRRDELASILKACSGDSRHYTEWSVDSLRRVIR